MADGTLPPEATGILERLGGWFQAIKESFYGCEAASARLSNREVLLTRRGNTLYVHLHRLPTMRRVLLDPISLAPVRATLLNTGAPVAWSLDDLPTLHMGAGGLLIPEEHHFLRLKDLPVNELAGTVPVIKLEFDRDPLSSRPTG